MSKKVKKLIYLIKLFFLLSFSHEVYAKDLKQCQQEAGTVKLISVLKSHGIVLNVSSTDTHAAVEEKAAFYQKADTLIKSNPHMSPVELYKSYLKKCSLV